MVGNVFVNNTLHCLVFLRIISLESVFVNTQYLESASFPAHLALCSAVIR